MRRLQHLQSRKRTRHPIIPAESIRRRGDIEVAPRRPEPVVATRLLGPICIEPDMSRPTLAELREKLGFDDADIVASIPQPGAPQSSTPAPVDTSWLVAEPFGYPLP